MPQQPLLEGANAGLAFVLDLIQVDLEVLRDDHDGSRSVAHQKFLNHQARFVRFVSFLLLVVLNVSVQPWGWS